ncbi:MAG: FtsH protease activity modulator HflK [Gammaproteobacteria bacterium]
MHSSAIQMIAAHEHRALRKMHATQHYNGQDDRDPWRNNDSSRQSGEPANPLEDISKGLRSLFGGGNSKDGSGKPKRPLWFLMLLLLLAIPLVWFLGGFYTLDAREQSVVLHLGKFETVHNEGLNWRMLIFDEIFIENTTEVRSYRHEAHMLTKDQNIISVPVTVQYVIEDIKEYVLHLDDPEHSLRLTTESAVRHVIGESTLDDALSVGREVIAAAIHERLQRYLKNYRNGLRVVKVNLLKGNPPQEVQADFVDVVRAGEDKERMRNEAEAYQNRILPETRGQASRLRQQAEGYRERVVAHATGDTQRIEQQFLAYSQAPEATRRRLYLETMQDVLKASSKIIVDTGEGDSLLYLPLDQLVKRENQAPALESGQDLRQLVEDIVKNHLGASESMSKARRR